jgi:hypothetical protein
MRFNDTVRFCVGIAILARGNAILGVAALQRCDISLVSIGALAPEVPDL